MMTLFQMDKEALATAINLNLDFNPESDDAPTESISTVTTAPAHIPLEYAEFSDVFEEKEIRQLSPHCPAIDHEIPLAPWF